MVQYFFRSSRLHINLDAITSNIENINKLAGDSKISVAIKSNAYGHGLVRIAQHLQSIGVNMLLVSSADEALALRENDISIPVLILSEVETEAIKTCWENDISFTVYSEKFINEIVKIATSQKLAKVHLKINTGMNRVGCEAHDVLKLATIISNESNLFMEGVYTHYATAEDLDPSGFEKQNTLFEYLLSELENIGIKPELVHSCNSAATIKYPKAIHNMVRVGLAAYGIYPKQGLEKQVKLTPALTLLSKISFIKPVQSHEKISYGWHYEFENNTQVATIPIGYGDGVPRNLGMRGGTVLIKGKRCKIVGVVTMDQLMVDIGDIDAQVGDEVILIGGDISVDEWANIMDTISWEILCSFSARLPRIYD